MYTHLFSEINIGSHVLRNRIIMSQSATVLAKIHSITEQMIAYYVERAKGGVGLIEMEPILMGAPYECTATDIFSLFTIENNHRWRELSELLHTYGTKLVCTLKYSNSITLDTADEFFRKFASTVHRIRDAGFDGLSLEQIGKYRDCSRDKHIMHDKDDNHCGRRDLEAPGAYGFQKTLQPDAIIRNINKTCGQDFLIGVHIDSQQSDDTEPGMKAFIKSAAELESAGANYLILYGKNTKLVKAVHENVDIPVAVQVKYQSPDECNKLISDGIADIVALNRQLICDPYWTEKAELCKKSEIRSCILTCSETCREPSVEGHIRCELNPYAGNESKYTEHNPVLAAKAKTIVVIGGGPAGMQTAITASKRGHYVIVFEKTEELGGMLLDKDPSTAHWFIDEMKRNHVDARLGVPENEEYVAAFKPDVVIIASGEKKQNKVLISGLRKKGINVVVIYNDSVDSSVGSAIRSGFYVANRI